MSDVELKRWAETWERAGGELSALRRRELQAMTDDDVRRAVADLFSGPLPRDLPERTTSGLIEQQRLFAVLRRLPFANWKLVFEELEPLAAVRNVPGLLDRLREIQDNVSRRD